MTDDKRTPQKLDNPPIKEAVIGVGISCFSSNDEIEDFYNNTDLHNDYPNKLSRKKILFSFNNEGHRIGQQEEGYMLQKENEELFVEKSRITLIDRNEYLSFDILLKKYQKIWNSFEKFISNKNKIFKVNDVALRYMNRFELPNPTKLKEQFLILPSIKLQDFDNEDIGILDEYLGSYSLQSDRYKSSGNIQVLIKPTINNTVEIIFDIDVHDVDNLPQDFNGIKNTLFRLKEFKNSIFFANIPNAKNLFCKKE